MTPEMILLQIKIEEQLAYIAKLLPPNYSLTLLARNVVDETGHDMVITKDDLRKVIASLSRLNQLEKEAT
jgi:hypothetical protein